MNIYLPNGYLNVRKLYSIDVPFIFIFSGRGIGKTYGGLEMVIEDDIQFMLMRRTQSQTDLINKPEFTPFKKLNLDKGWTITTKQVSKYNSGIYEDEEGGLPIGYTCALSTLSNMRGFDASDVEVLIYDEFIPERHERPLKNEASALWNAYETINRNRELNGDPALKLMAFANSNDIANPIFMDLGVVKTIRRMEKKGQEVYINRDKGLCIVNVMRSPISEAKSDTALYKLKKGSDFNNMAIGNKFSNEVAGRMRSRNLREYKPLVAIGELCIYEHKHNNTLYATLHKSGAFEQYGTGDIERARFIKDWRFVWLMYLDNDIEFEEYTCEILLTHAFK